LLPHTVYYFIRRQIFSLVLPLRFSFIVAAPQDCFRFFLHATFAISQEIIGFLQFSSLMLLLSSFSRRFFFFFQRHVCHILTTDAISLPSFRQPAAIFRRYAAASFHATPAEKSRRRHFRRRFRCFRIAFRHEYAAAEYRQT
jgi:hypothetical protein